ncbi:alpha/beta fold hydrolase [Pelagicoccus sp. SDUM812003]|uniref:alpha/beta fold hydrolase n=1 Tax=Pelagicoccus sp. SDUM812003 TaxID=3041267 RepID=UPI00280DAB7C|nr:alpha/beta fold hydrolase [Pelagicoccus sp. SDUM812003]MDQ8201815.1 alpha/beta fold hydrolase [Pelagicoccus sp. SDUM812003]
MKQDSTTSKRLRVRDGTELHCEWIRGSSTAWLVCVHGIGEHIGREAHLSRLFADRFNIFRYDLRGHGKSDGLRGYIDSFDTYFRDLEDIVAQLSSTHPNFRYTLFGHSMGALIAAGFAQSCPEQAPAPERLFLASPPIGLGGRGGAMVNSLPRGLVNALCKTPFSIPIGSTLNRHNLSHDKAIARNLETDSLSLKRLHTKLLFGLVQASREVFSRPIAAPCPIFGAIGGDDRIVSCSEALEYFDTHEPGADFRVFEGAYHELHNETDEYRQPYFDFLKTVLTG